MFGWQLFQFRWEQKAFGLASGIYFVMKNGLVRISGGLTIGVLKDNPVPR
jgi:hypothetical protein